MTADQETCANALQAGFVKSRRPIGAGEIADGGAGSLGTHTFHEKAGDLLTAAPLYADAALSASNLAERDHLTRQGARINHALRG